MYNLPKAAIRVWSVNLICKNVIMIYICVFQTAIAAYIRLFEPLVFKVLKQYTVTSSLELQQQVLYLLSQLVQQWVNYCLLDSDQVFIGFIIKQFEYIKEGQIRWVLRCQSISIYPVISVKQSRSVVMKTQDHCFDLILLIYFLTSCSIAF